MFENDYLTLEFVYLILEDQSPLFHSDRSEPRPHYFLSAVDWHVYIQTAMAGFTFFLPPQWIVELLVLLGTEGLATLAGVADFFVLFQDFLLLFFTLIILKFFRTKLR